MALLELSGVAKTYPGTRALAGVDLTVHGGEVHAVLGQNGAGKSTLMKVIAGSVTPDGGTMTVDGAAVAFGSPEAARAAGIAMVYQELSLVGSLTVGENVLLGRQPTTRWGTVDWAALHREAARHLERIGLDVDPRRGVAGMGTAERQLVEIAKALSSDVRVLVLDEPTSALSDPEARRLFNVVGDLTAAGVAVLYVSHRLPEVLEISDRVTVLRDGERVGTFAASEVDEDRLARMLVGTPTRPEPAPEPRPEPEPAPESKAEPEPEPEAETAVAAETSAEAGSPTAVAGREAARAGAPAVLLRVRGLTRPPRLKPVDLELHAGEVVGVFGLVGSGRTRLVNALFGLEPATGGVLEVDGRRAGKPATSPVDAIRLGIGYVGEDRAATLVPRLTVAANITMASMGKLGRGGLLDLAGERRLGRRYVDELAIKATAERPVGTLSGGNQQKVVLARWLCSGARVLLLDDATRGIDVGAKEEVFRLVRRFAADGGAVLYMTSEIREARAVADRVLVMADGRIATAVDPDTPEAEIMAAAGGVHG